LRVKYQLILGFACRRTGKKNDTRPKNTPSSDVTAHKPFASKIPAYFGACVPTHGNRECKIPAYFGIIVAYIQMIV